MRHICFLFILFIIINCNGGEEQKNESFCGVEDPKNELLWLKEIIDIAETHQNFNYIGAIYAEEYLGKDVVFVEMLLGDGGLPGHWFNCDGTAMRIISGNSPIATRKHLIYKSYD